MIGRKGQYIRVVLSGRFREGPLQSKSPLNRSAADDFRLDRFLALVEWTLGNRRVSRVLIDHREDFAPRLFAGAEEVRRQLLRLREAGKELFFVSSELDDVGLFIAAAAHHVILHPTGTVRLRGLSRSFSFIKRRLDQEGISAYVHRRGVYKSAGDVVRTDRMDDATREQYERYLELVQNEMLRVIADGFSISLADLKTMQDSPQLLGADAREVGLCSDLKSSGDLEDSWRNERLHEASPKLKEARFTSAKPTDRKERRKRRIRIRVHRAARVAIVVLEGSIMPGDSRRTPLMGQALGSRSVVETLVKLRRNKRIKAVVARINSPGGSAVASDEMRHELAKLAEAKPLYVSMSELAGSGGYWIATVGRRLFANRTSLTGSIGVITLSLDASAWLRRQGFGSEVVKTASMADSGTISRAPTEQETRIAEHEVDAYYQAFLERVASFRNLSREAVDRVAQGRVWAGQDAREVDLVDEVGGISDVLDHVRRELGADRLRVEYHPQPRLGFVEKLIAGNLSSDAGADTQQLANLLRSAFLRDPDTLGVLRSPLAVTPELWDHWL